MKLIGITLNLKRSGISMWFERWFLSSNAKDIGVLYLIYALFSGLIKPELKNLAICFEGTLILLFIIIIKKYLWADNYTYSRSFYVTFNISCLFGYPAFILDSTRFSSIIPVKIYNDIEKDKNLIIQENKDKSGIYCFTDKTDKRQYIGSAVKITRRLRKYFSSTTLIYELTKSNSHIYRAILDKGLSNFSLSILEYCEPNKCIERENYYFKLLAPKYNILAVAGSSKGFKHSLETRQKMSYSQIRIGNRGRFKTGVTSGENHPLYGKKGIDSAWFGKKHSEETIYKMRIAKQGEKHPMFGKPRPEKAGKPSIKLKVLDKETNKTTIYSSISEAATSLNINPRRIYMYFSRNQVKPYKNKYVFTKMD